MHWESHCEAFYAQWMIRYLHPRKAPWKEIADLWICEGTQSSGARHRIWANFDRHHSSPRARSDKMLTVESTEAEAC